MVKLYTELWDKSLQTRNPQKIAQVLKYITSDGIFTCIADMNHSGLKWCFSGLRVISMISYKNITRYHWVISPQKIMLW